MTKQEAKKILATLQIAYPHAYKDWGEEEGDRAASLWSAMFADDDYSLVSSAVTAIIASSTAEFPPPIGAVKQKLYSLTDGADDDTAMEAWAKVRKAIGRGAYHAREAWEALPEDIRRCVTPEQINAWATDDDFNEGVVMSQFVKSYGVRTQRAIDYKLIPEQTKAALEGSGARLIQSETSQPTLLIAVDEEGNTYRRRTDDVSDGVDG